MPIQWTTQWPSGVLNTPDVRKNLRTALDVAILPILQKLENEIISSVAYPPLKVRSNYRISKSSEGGLYGATLYTRVPTYRYLKAEGDEEGTRKWIPYGKGSDLAKWSKKTPDQDQPPPFLVSRMLHWYAINDGPRINTAVEKAYEQAKKSGQDAMTQWARKWGNE